MEARAGSELLGPADRELVAQQRLGCHQDQRLAEVAVKLSAQDVEVVGGRRAVRNDPVVGPAHLQEPLQPGTGVLRALTFVAVRQQADEARHAQPFGLAGRDELVEHDLRAVGEVAELRLPHREGVRLGEAVAILKPEHGVFRQGAVDRLEMRLPLADVIQGVIAVLVLLIDEGGVPLAEGAARRVLARQADLVALGQQRAERQRFGGGPVKALAALEHRGLAVQDAAHRLVDREAVGGGRQPAAHVLERVGCDGGLAADVVVLLAAVEVRPAAVEPVGLVGLVIATGLEFLRQALLKGGLHVLDLALGDQAVLDEPLGIKRQRGLLPLDLLVHHRVREHGLVALVMSEPAVAENVEHNVLGELLAELDGDAGGVDDGLRVVAVDMKDRGLDDQGVVGGVGAGAREVRRSGKTDLVVDDDVDGAAGAVAAHAGEREAFRHDALPREGRVAVQQDRGDLTSRRIAQLVLLGADLAQDDGVHGFEVRGVGRQRQMHGIAVEFSV